MANKEIKNRIVLEGEKEYNQAIREAQRNLKTLRSELKAETAELGKNATEQQKAETRARNLRQQIKEQEKVVKTLRDALDQAKKEYGDNADVVQSWEQKLNNARATLGNMKNELDGLGDGFKKAQQDAAMGTVAAKSFADSIGQIAAAGESVSRTIENLFKGMVTTVGNAIGAVWEDMVDLAGKANAWVDLAGFWNTDAKTIQDWSNAVQGAHNSFDDLNNAVTRINMGDQKKIAEATGVSGENFEDKWAYAMAVMDSMAKMDYEDKLNAAGAVFGEKRATKILDLLNDWQTIRSNLQKFEGIGMSEDQINDMSTLAEKVSLIETTWQAFLASFEAEHFAKLALDLTGNAQRILEDLIKFIDTGSDEDLAQLEKDIEEFFDRIKEALEKAAEKLGEAGKKLEESDNGIVRAIGKAMQGLAGALEWISKDENINKVIHSFEALALFWAAGKGVKLIGSIASLAANIKVLQGFNLGTFAANAAGAGAAGAAGATSLSTLITSAITSAAGPIATAIAGLTLSVGVITLAVPVVSALRDVIAGKWPDWLPDPNKSLGETALPDADKETQEAVTKALEQGTPGNKRDALQWGIRKLLGGDKEPAAAAEETIPDPLAGQPTVYVGAGGPSSPVRSARIDATAEQQAAAEAFWDIWRSEEYTDEEFDQAFDAMEAAFAGNEKQFDRLNTLLDKLMEEKNSAETENGFNPASWQDIPATWWQNPAGGETGSGITSQDLQSFRGLPAGMMSAVQRGASAGVSGIKVNLDGQTVGRLVAPYVSQEIARMIE